MENRNEYDPNLRYQTTPQAERKSGFNWGLAAVVVVALALGIGYINHRNNDNLNDISPAAGDVVNDSTTISTPASDTSLPSTNGTLNNDMPPQPTPSAE
ncbi:MAG TPA: hypothetical protein VEF76_03780 [Patescibacteria group bacterium]|nr:hypothetical protein [Patescibacteria group bacterium]